MDAERRVGMRWLVGNVVVKHLTFFAESFVSEADVDENSAQNDDESASKFKQGRHLGRSFGLLEWLTPQM